MLAGTQRPRLDYAGDGPVRTPPAIIKGARMDFLVEKATELGASERPLRCARGVARAANEQSLAARPMRVGAPLAHDLILSMPDDTLPLVCRMGAEPLYPALRGARPKAVLLACGPEGDFDEAEFAILLGAGFTPVGLGNGRVHSETAALAALSITRAALDELETDERDR